MKNQPRLKKQSSVSSDTLTTPLGIPVSDSQTEQQKGHQEGIIAWEWAPTISKRHIMIKAPEVGLCTTVLHLEQKSHSTIECPELEAIHKD